MNLRLIRLARRAVGFIGIALFVVLVVFSLFTHLAPLAGRQLFIIGGGSMEPAIPLGSLVVVTPADASTIMAGDVITIRADNGVVVTHRVSRVVDLPEGRFFEMKGDANQSADGSLVPARAVVGTANQHLPYVGYAQAVLSTIPGVIATFSILGSLLLAYVLLKMLDTTDPTRPPEAGPVTAVP
jgi:signal peptidase